jgi:uncharacterized repeat protein (TIGR02543 family)
MLKNLKKAAAIVLSFAMAVQFGLADSYYVNAVEEPVEPQQEETTTTTPQEQEEVPTTEEETPQQQEEGQPQPAVEEEQPAAEEAQTQPVEQAEVKVSYVKEDDTDLMESVTATYDVGYRLDQDTNVFKEAHEAFEFEYAFVNGNKENKITKDQVKASGLTVTSDMTSLTLVYKSTATQNESKDKKVETANLSGEKEDDSDSEDDIATVANNSIELKVGEKATLDSSDVEDWGYNHQHKWTVNKKNIVNLSSKSGSSITVTGEGVGTATVTDTYTYSSFMGGSKRGTKTYTINVTAAVTPTGISISGADTVKQFQTTQLTANLTPEGANGKVTWTSSNEQILSVDENGLVTGNRQGSATITASVQGADKNTLSATKTIEVVKNESPSSGNKREALVYYLKDPTKDANSNGSDQWGPSSLGTAVVNVEGATWTGNKNCFDNVDQRVLSWPTDLNGTNVVPRSNNAWNLIFDAYKASIEKELKVTITKDDVEEITLVPAKISKDNGTTPDMHLDCNVNIKCKSVALVKYWLFDANGTKYEMQGSKNYLVKDESTTQPSDVTSKKFPTTKTVDGVTYTFSGWYTDQSLTTSAPSFPAKVTGSVNYYAKYVAGYQVKYNLADGQFSDGSTSATEKHNVDTTVVVKEVPTRKGYKFTGWTVEGLDGTTTINSGDTFTMPNGNVTLTANWQEQKIADFITLTPTDVIKPYDGKTYTAGTATVSGKTASPIPTDLKIEYSIDGKTWTTDPSTITATNVSDSKIVKVRVSSDNYTGELKGEENLEITKRPVTVTGRTYTKVYGTADPELEADVDNLVKGDKIDYAVTRAPGNDVGDYAVIPSGEKDQGNYEVTYKNGKLTITKAEKFELHAALSAESRKKTYDGNKLEGAATATVTEGTTISYSVDGGEWTTKVPSIKNVKKVTVKAKAENPNYETPDEIEYTLEITKRPVTVTGRTYTKVYGTADPELEADVDNLVKGDKIDYAVTRAPGNDVGDYAVIPSGEKDQGNYEVTYKNGKLTITKAETMTLTPELTGKDAEKEYDSKPLSGGATASVTKGTTITYSTDGGKTWSEELPSITDVGTLNVKAKAENKNYKDVTVDYTLKVTRKAVTVTADNKSKLFGETDPKLTAKVAGTLGNDTVEYKLSRKTGEAVGKYEITVKGDKLQGNYTVTYAVGTLTITSQSIDPGTDPEKPNPDYTGAKVNSPSDKVYDGNEHKWIPTVTDKADKKLKAGTDYKVEYSTSDFTNVGTVEVTITGKGNYTGTVKRSYKVTPKEYTVTTDSATKTYSGTALTAGGKVEGIVSGETVEFTTTGSQTEVGTSKNTYELVWKSAKATNYKLAKESIGKLTVKAKSIVPDDKDTPESDKTGITVSEPSDSKYDGKEHKEVLTVTDTKTGKELVAGTDYSVTYSSDLVNAGTVKVTVAGLGNYTGSFTKTYKITKRSVTLTSATVGKVYDGSALTNTDITVSGDGFVEGEGASYEVTGTQTEVGNSANAFEYKLNEKTLASNYNITKVVGTLTITAAPAPVTPATPSTPSTPSSTTSTTPRTPSAPQATTPAETVEKETTPKAEPKKEEKVEEEYTPKASPQYYWALINLICAILTVLFGLLLLISKRHKSEDDEEDDETKDQTTTNDDEEKEEEKKRGLFTRVLAVLIAIVSVVFFLVTEDLSLPWTWTDQWTIWMVVIGLVQIVVFFVGRKWKNVDNDDDDEEAQQA